MLSQAPQQPNPMTHPAARFLESASPAQSLTSMICASSRHPHTTCEHSSPTGVVVGVTVVVRDDDDTDSSTVVVVIGEDIDAAGVTMGLVNSAAVVRDAELLGAGIVADAGGAALDDAVVGTVVAFAVGCALVVADDDVIGATVGSAVVGTDDELELENDE
eukprot:3937399-Rhodomonas_salina.1